MTTRTKLILILNCWRASSKGEFVIQGRDNTDFKSRVSYRCEPVHAVLYEWRRKHGVTAQKTLHELRTETGALVAKTLSIYAASRLLRHSDIRVTADYYTDKKQRISKGLKSYSFAIGGWVSLHARKGVLKLSLPRKKCRTAFDASSLEGCRETPFNDALRSARRGARGPVSREV